MNTCQTPFVLALDFPNATRALHFVAPLSPLQCRLKVGKELFTREGPAIVEALQKKGFEVFLDLKFHDIPNTAAMAVKAAAELGVWMVNVHCSGGLRMLQACREVLAQRSGANPLLIGVTVLTSMERASALTANHSSRYCALPHWLSRPGWTAWFVPPAKRVRSKPRILPCNW